MATKPIAKTLNANSVQILNAIRNSASTNYRDYVPVAQNNLESVREIGAIIMDYPALKNEFLSALVNRIGMVLITNKMYANPWSVFNRGRLELGETVEEIFVNIAKPFQFDPAVAETKVFAREIPDVRSAFHVMNYQHFYKQTIQNEQLRQAFLSWDGVTDLIAKIVDAMYSGASYDEFVVMKYLLARHILNGQLYAREVGEATAANAKAVVSAVKGVSNAFEFMSTKYNIAGVANYTPKDEQYIIVNAAFDAIMDVEVLASAFNMNKAEFMGHRVMVDSFAEMDDARLADLFKNDPNYKPITQDEKAVLDKVPAVLVSRDYFMILDNLYQFTEQYNGEGLYWNYWYHVWKTFSVSPFHNAAVFVPGEPTVDSITISPESAQASAGQQVQFSAEVKTQNFAPKSVKWTTDKSGNGVTVTPDGVVTIPAQYSDGDITVTATSTFDDSKTKTATITFSA